MLNQRVRALEDMADQDQGVSSGPTLAEYFATFQNLPAIRGLWYPNISFNGNVLDSSVHQSGLVDTNAAQVFIYNSLVPYIDFNGVNQYLTAADAGWNRILGTETYVSTAIHGLTWGGWFWANAVGSTQKLMSKGNNASAAGSAYEVMVQSAGKVTASVYSGASAYNAISADGVLSAAKWFFAVGRYYPSVEVAAFANGIKVASTTAAIPASLNNPAQPFQIAAVNGGGLLAGRMAVGFICASAFTDTLIRYLFRRTRVLFGV
jgi:hypothetical protein